MSDEREPLPLTLLICDGVHVDPGSGKRTLLGLFSVVWGEPFPIVLSQMAIYAAITECLGPTTVEIKIVDAAEEREPVVTIKGKMECKDPLAVQEMSFFFKNVTFPEPGEYRVQLFAGGAPLMERRLMAMRMPLRPAEEHGEEPENE